MDGPNIQQREQLARSEVQIRFSDAHIGCPFSFILQGYTVSLLKKLYPFTKRERKDGVEHFEVWYKLEAFPPDEPKWERLMADEMLPNNAIVAEWRMLDPTGKTRKQVNKVKIV